ncbi:MAG: hypothetical protein MUC36_10385 [Planctomycetes bacterium]|jgi:hypothetical protein|nr:hypothetical protein [Planctomycetota bacterium]
MENLDRDPSRVLDQIVKLAEEIAKDVPHIGVDSPVLDEALKEVAWLEVKSVWFKSRGYILERITALRGHLEALAADGQGFTRAEQLYWVLSEVDRLRMRMTSQWLSSELGTSR